MGDLISTHTARVPARPKTVNDSQLFALWRRLFSLRVGSAAILLLLLIAGAAWWITHDRGMTQYAAPIYSLPDSYIPPMAAHNENYAEGP